MVPRLNGVLMANHSTNSLWEPLPETSRLLWEGRGCVGGAGGVPIPLPTSTGGISMGQFVKSATAEEVQSGLKPYHHHHPQKVDGSLRDERRRKEAESNRGGGGGLAR